MKKSEILKIAQSNAERISAIEKHLFGEQPEESKQLEVGKWYKSTDPHKKALFCSTNGQCSDNCGYGLDYKGDWRENFCLSGSQPEELIEATPQEVEHALIEEAKKRGYKKGARVELFCTTTKCPVLCNDKEFVYKRGSEELIIVGGDTYRSFGDSAAVIFKGGKWATIIEDDKFAELKEAHKNGAVIQVNYDDNRGWLDTVDPKWASIYEYRIKPLEEKPKEGTICKFWDDNEDEYIISTVVEIDDTLIPFLAMGGNWYYNAKPLSKSEVIELLFGKDENNGQ